MKQRVDGNRTRSSQSTSANRKRSKQRTFDCKFSIFAIVCNWKKVKSLPRSETESIRTRIQHSKQKREITIITTSQNTKRTYGQPREQLFPKRWPLSNRNQTKTNMNTHKVKRHRNPDTKNRQQRTTTKLPPWNKL